MRLMTATLLILAAITFVSTVAGGLVAVRFRRILQYFFAFSSGALIGITFFDVLPEVYPLPAPLACPCVG